MSKILKNNSNPLVAIELPDIGFTLPTSPDYTMNSTEYDLFASSDGLVTAIGNEDIIVNDGSFDLGISDGIDLIKGIFPSTVAITSQSGGVASVKIGGTGSHDSFGRLRVSDISNIFESTHSNSEQAEFWDMKTVGGATVTHHSQHSEMQLNVGTASGDHALRQTLNYFHYAAGQSMMIRLTGVLGSGKTNLDSCCGYYDDNNGLVFRVSDGVFQVGIRSDISGSVVETWVNQDNFNIDKMDGTGESGIILDLDKTQIFQIEYQWLGVGSVTMSVHINGNQYYLHRFDNANISDKVYMRTPHLPVRYEIMNTGVTASASTVSQICTQVANEGKSIVGDLINVVDNGVDTKAISSSSFKPVLSYRHKQGSLILTELISITNMVTTTDDVLIEVYIDATLTGASWTNHSQFIESDTSATAISGGRRVASFYVSKEASSPSGSFDSKFRLGQYIDGTPQHVTICAKSFVNSAAMVSAFTFKELF